MQESRGGDAEPVDVPYGFRFLWQYSGHSVSIKACEFSPVLNQFASLDDKCIRVWGNKGRDDYFKLTFPPTLPNFIQCIIYVPFYRVYIASALDMNLKVYNKSFELQSSVAMSGFRPKGRRPKGERAVISLAFNPQTKDLICGGASGVSVYKFRKGRAEHWHPGAVAGSVVYSLTNCRRLEGCKGWIHKVELDESAGRLIVYKGAGVLFYDPKTLQLLLSMEHLHRKSSVTGCALFLSLNYIVTSGHDAKIQVWSTLHKNTLVHSFNQHARAVTGLARHSVPGLLVSASLDGTVRVWDVESLKELYKLNALRPIHGINVHMETLLLTAGNTVLAWSLHHISTRFAICRSAVSSIIRFESLFRRDKPKLLAAWALSMYVKLTGHGIDHPFAATLESELQGHPPIAVADQILATSVDGSARVVSADKGQNLSTMLPDRKRTSGQYFLFSPEQDLLFAFAQRQKEEGVAPPGASLLGSLTSGGTRSRPTANSIGSTLESVEANKDIVRIFSTRVDPSRAVQKWDLNALFQSEIDTKQGLEPISCLVLSDTAPSSLHASFHGKNSGRILHTSEPQEKGGDSVRGYSDRSDSPVVLVAATVKGRLIFYNTRDSGRAMAYAQIERDPIVHLFYNSLLRVLITISATSCIKIIRISDLAVVHEIPIILSSGDRLSCVSMAQISNLLLLGFCSGTLQILDIKIGKYLDLQSNYEHTREVTCADFADRIGLFVTGSLDCKVKIWNYKKELMRELAMTQPIQALRFLDISGNLIVGEGQNISLISARTYLKRSHVAGIANRLRRYVAELLERLSNEVEDIQDEEEFARVGGEAMPGGEHEKRGTQERMKMSKKASMKSMAKYLSMRNVLREEEEVKSMVASIQDDDFAEALVSIRKRPAVVLEVPLEEEKAIHRNVQHGAGHSVQSHENDKLTLGDLLPASRQHEASSSTATETSCIAQAKAKMHYQPVPVLQRRRGEVNSQVFSDASQKVEIELPVEEDGGEGLVPKSTAKNMDSSVYSGDVDGNSSSSSSVHLTSPERGAHENQPTDLKPPPKAHEEVIVVTTRREIQEEMGKLVHGEVVGRRSEEAGAVEGILTVKSCAVGYSQMTPDTLREMLAPVRPNARPKGVTPRVVHLQFGNASSALAKREYMLRQKALQHLGPRSLSRPVKTNKPPQKADFLPLFPPLSEAEKKHEKERKAAASPSRLKPWTVEGAPAQFL